MNADELTKLQDVLIQFATTQRQLINTNAELLAIQSGAHPDYCLRTKNITLTPDDKREAVLKAAWPYVKNIREIASLYEKLSPPAKATSQISNSTAAEGQWMGDEPAIPLVKTSFKAETKDYEGIKFRFFKNLSTAERLNVFKVFLDLSEKEASQVSDHGIERMLLKRILNGNP